jgi:CubicO group peptidase (beta-lactamase class C family)
VLLTLVLAAIATAPADGLPVKAPRAVGMSAERLETIDRVVQRGISAGGYPGASVVVGRKGATVWSKGFGRLGWGANSPHVLADRSIYDLENVTHYLPQFSGGLKDAVTVRQLLTHRGGLPAGRELWRHAKSPDEARQLVFDAPLEYRPGTGFVYSDLGADLLGMVVESITGKGLDVFLRERVFEPLGMNDTAFLPADSLVYRIAPTEVSPPRGYPLRGQVHDENAFALGGVAGHAGLFGTASDLAIFAQMLLNAGTYNGVRIVSDTTVHLFTARAAGSRALGWEVGEGQHGAGTYFGERAFGHTGFTGTSMWIDPDREMFVILLTNRVHAARARRPAKVIADVRADLADAAALAVMDENLAVGEMPALFRSDRAVGWNRAFRRAPSRGKGRGKAVAANKNGARSSVSRKKVTAETSSLKKPGPKKQKR